MQGFFFQGKAAEYGNAHTPFLPRNVSTNLLHQFSWNS